jgi:two-component system OmpR family response regulator
MLHYRCSPECWKKMAQCKILYVDDEPDIRELVEISLGLDDRHEIRTCSSGAEALSVVPEWQPDLILMDVMMPGMDGPSTLAKLRESGVAEGIPVVFMTARTQKYEIEHFMEIGAAGVIAKPFDPVTLAENARRYLPEGKR